MAREFDTPFMNSVEAELNAALTAAASMTPLERAARAAAREMVIPDEGRMKPERVARAVIEAIREPSEAMLLAGAVSSASVAWEDMIDALLEEGR